MDDAAIRVSVLGNLSLSGEFGLALNSRWHGIIRKELTEEEAFLWFWGLASVAKSYRDAFGFDSPSCYVWSYLAKDFEDYLERLGRRVLDDRFLRGLGDAKAPTEVTTFIKKSLREGYGNWVANSRFNSEELFRYLYLIQAFYDGKWDSYSVNRITEYLRQFGI